MLPLAVGLLFLLGLGGLAWYTGALPAGQEDEQPGAAAAETGGVAEPESPGAVPDEDRVVRLLEDNGGRMKQVDIVEETDWSKSKVSMLLSEMEEEGEISKLRVGRENIISLSGHEPDAAGSPFDEE
jgi:predicted Rossmann fold nucleotide-binding protein DprA/Smf involved in DNA uptake